MPLPTERLACCFPKSSACGQLLASKNNHQCSHPHINIECEGERYSDLKICISELILNRY